MQKRIAEVVIECVRGDITAQKDMDAVVNAANAELRPGGGVAGAIHRAAGAELDSACRTLAPIRPGEAVITDAFKLPNKKVIHCLGPVYGEDEPAKELLASCYREAIALAEKQKLKSIAFPPISTGAFGYPLKEAATVALRTVKKIAPSLKYLKTIRFVLWGEESLKAHEDALRNLHGYTPTPNRFKSYG